MGNLVKALATPSLSAFLLVTARSTFPAARRARAARRFRRRAVGPEPPAVGPG